MTEPREPDDDGEPIVHVYPLFGRFHVLDGWRCWCSPQPDAHEPHVAVHRPDH